MPSIGKTAKLQIIKEVDFGLYLDGEDLGEILLPARYVPADYQMEDWLDVFIYLDSEDRIIATTEKPYAEVGQCAYLKVVETNAFGAFLEWGLAKNLLVPFREQRAPMQQSRSYVVYIYEDDSGRLSASSKLNHFLSEKSQGHFKLHQAVELLIVSHTDLGYKAVINGTHLGLLHGGDALTKLKIGEKITGYIKKIRTDDAIDLMMQPIGKKMRHDLAHQILEDLKSSGGRSRLTDKSTAQEIFDYFQVSKGNYKKALGQLYKEKKIILGEGEITLIQDQKDADFP